MSTRRNNKRVCVQAKDGRWCALVREPDPEAIHDELACGYWMNFRHNTSRRVPTCPECRDQLAAAVSHTEEGKG